MKTIFVLLMLTAFAMVCSCHKEDSAAEEELAQRKLQLDAREEALAERKSVLDEGENALNKREKALQQREKSLAAKEEPAMNAQTDPANVQDPAEMKDETDSLTQELRARVPDLSQAVTEKAEMDSELQGTQKMPELGELRIQKQLDADELQRKKERIMDAAGISPAPQ